MGPAGGPQTKPAQVPDIGPLSSHPRAPGLISWSSWPWPCAWSPSGNGPAATPFSGGPPPMAVPTARRLSLMPCVSSWRWRVLSWTELLAWMPLSSIAGPGSSPTFAGFGRPSGPGGGCVRGDPLTRQAGVTVTAGSLAGAGYGFLRRCTWPLLWAFPWCAL